MIAVPRMTVAGAVIAAALLWVITVPGVLVMIGMCAPRVAMGCRTAGFVAAMLCCRREGDRGCRCRVPHVVVVWRVHTLNIYPR